MQTTPEMETELAEEKTKLPHTWYLGEDQGKAAKVLLHWGQNEVQTSQGARTVQEEPVRPNIQHFNKLKSALLISRLKARGLYFAAFNIVIRHKYVFFFFIKAYKSIK